MASPEVSCDDPLTTITKVSHFEECQISPAITADDAPTFFREHGIFYEENADIGRQARELAHDDSKLREMLMRNPVSMAEQRLVSWLISLLRFASILEPFIKNPPVTTFLGPLKGHFLAVTNKDNQDHRLIVYIWPGETVFEFFDESHKGLNKGVPAANGHVQIPYSWLKGTRKLQEFRGVMKEGGLYVSIIRFFTSIF